MSLDHANGWNWSGKSSNVYAHQPVVSLTNVVEAGFIEQNLLENECRHCLAQLRSE